MSHFDRLRSRLSEVRGGAGHLPSLRLPGVPTLEQRHVEGAILCADRFEMLKHITLGPDPVIAEVGVAYGEFSRALIDRFRPREFHAFDIFTMHTLASAWGRDPREVFQGKTHAEFYRDRFAADAGVKIFEGDSSTELSRHPDALYDLIYVDGAHDYQGVKRDAHVAVKKLTQNGVLVFNDYIMFDHIAGVPYGVVQVVNDLCANHGWRMTHFALQNVMFCDVALMRIV